MTVQQAGRQQRQLRSGCCYCCQTAFANRTRSQPGSRWLTTPGWTHSLHVWSNLNHQGLRQNFLDTTSCALQVAGKGQVWLAFSDHSNDSVSPGWALRNAALLAAARWELSRLKVVAVRLRRGRACPERSLALSMLLPAIPAGGRSVRRTVHYSYMCL